MHDFLYKMKFCVYDDITHIYYSYATGKPQVVANCGLMLRACTRYKSLVWVILLLKSDDVLQFFDFMQAKQFEVLADAFVTFKELLKHEDLTTKFLEENHEEVHYFCHCMFSDCSFSNAVIYYIYSFSDFQTTL